MCWWGKWIVEFRRFIHMLDISISNRSLNLNDSFCLFMLRYFHLKCIVEIHMKSKKCHNSDWKKAESSFFAVCCSLHSLPWVIDWYIVVLCLCVSLSKNITSFCSILENSSNFRVCRGISVYPWKLAISSEKVFLLFFSMTLGFHDSPLSWLLLALQYIATLCATKLWPVSQV